MLKLIGFEFKRKRMLFLIALVLTVLGQMFALYKYFEIDERLRSFYGGEIIGIFLLLVGLAFAIVYFIDVITLFRGDLFKQSGYMLFLTPNSGYKLLGAKLIFALLEGLSIACVYMMIVVLNVWLVPEFVFDFEMIREITTLVTGEQIYIAVKGLLLTVLTLIEFALTVYLAFALFKSLFTNTRFKGVMTFGIFIGILIAKSQIMSFISYITQSAFSTTLDGLSMVESIHFVLNFGIVGTLISALILFFGTGYLLEKRINL